MSTEQDQADAGVRLAKLLRDEYWAQTPLDVAKLADEVLQVTTPRSTEAAVGSWTVTYNGGATQLWDGKELLLQGLNNVVIERVYDAHNAALRSQQEAIENLHKILGKKRVEIQQLKKDRDEWRESAAGYGSDAEQLRESLRAQQQDTERLDTMEKAFEIRKSKRGWAVLMQFTNYEYDLHPTLREAADAAMRGEGGKDLKPEKK